MVDELNQKLIVNSIERWLFTIIDDNNQEYIENFTCTWEQGHSRHCHDNRVHDYFNPDIRQLNIW